MTAPSYVKDAQAALRSSGAEPDPLEAILTSFDANYVWNYGDLGAGLRELYEKGKSDQWNSTTDLDWSTDVDPQSEIMPMFVNPMLGYGPYERLDRREKGRVWHAQISMQLSQFLHGEQGAMIVASQLVSAVPWMDAKFYASSQTMDEARHVEVFSRYIREKLEWEWPINPHLKELLDATILDRRWDFKYMGMQILVEGLAMAAFGNLHQLVTEPLLKRLLHAVMRDESRHVAFGMMSLRGHYDEMAPQELKEREDFIMHACSLMKERLIDGTIGIVMGWKPDEVAAYAERSDAARLFRTVLFQRIVPNLKRLGLLTPRVRGAFETLDILQFEGQDATEQDRELGFL
jgi:hypothetical protein